MSKRIVIRREVVTRAVTRRAGIPGKSAYQSYLDTTSDDPPLSESEWSAGGGGGTVTWVNISGKPTEFPPSTHSHSWDSVSGKPETFPPQTHTHNLSDLGAQATLTHYTSISSLAGYPAGFAPTAHKTSHASGGSDALTPADIGAEPSLSTASQAEMETGTESAIRSMSPLRVSQAIAALAPTGSDRVTYVVLAEDTSPLSSNTNYADEIAMAFPSLAANKAYRFDWSIPVTAGAGGVKLRLTVPSAKNTATLSIGRYYGNLANGTDIVITSSDPKTFVLGFRSTNSGLLCGTAIVHISSTGGAPVLQWAQLNSSSETTKLLAGAVVTVTPLFP